MRGFRIFIACLVLGVGSIAAIGSLGASVGAAIRQDARILFGGDVSARLVHRQANAAERDFLEASGKVSELALLRAMAVSPDGARHTLIELKAVDAAYPLYGAVALTPAQELAAALAPRDGVYGAVTEPAVAERLGLKIGDRFKIGAAVLQLRATVERLPDAALSGLAFGPGTIVSAAALGETGLIQPGALVNYEYRIRLPPGADAAAWTRAARDKFPDAGWQLRTATQATPQLQRFIDRIGLFLDLVGITALLVGGIGIGSAVSYFVAGKTATIATLKSLGASSRLVFTAYAVQIGVLAGAGIGVGLVLGALVPRDSGAVARSVAAGAAAARRVSRAARRRRGGGVPDRADVRPAAAGCGRPGDAGRAVPRPGRAGAPARAAGGPGGDGGGRARTGGADRLDRARPGRGALVRRRRGRELCRVPRRRGADRRGRAAGGPAAPDGAAPGAGQSAPPRRADRAGGAVAWGSGSPCWSRWRWCRRAFPTRSRAASPRLRPGISSSTSSPLSSTGLRRWCRRSPGRATPRCRCCAAASPGSRRAGRAGACRARGAMGAAQRPRPDLCGASAAGLGDRRRRLVAGGLQGAAADLVRRRARRRAWGSSRATR